VPKIIHGKKKTVGIRVPDNKIITQIVHSLGHPIISTSVDDEDGIVENCTDPELIYEKYRNLVDIMIDGGYGGIEPSTILDCLGDDFEIVRQGKGII
jgi:tRNA A37 threonylcarbamoyladenosine synthetase subunit TsaC/SUA5/YrdC